MNRVVDYLRRNAVRVYAVVVAVLALVAHYVPGLPSDLLLGVVAAGLALFGGEVVQRVENRKSVESYEYGVDETLNEV